MGMEEVDLDEVHLGSGTTAVAMQQPPPTSALNL
jgi:hypothetical protein